MMHKITRLRKFRARAALSTAGLLGLLALGGTAALATNESSSPLPAPVEPTATVDAADQATFAVLRRTRTVADDVPREHIAVFEGPSGANLGLARRARGFGTGAAWVFPGRGSVYLMAQGGGSCVPDAAAAGGELVETSGSRQFPGTEFLAGVVPDGVGQVSVHLSNGTEQMVTVHDNVYLDSTHGRFSTVSLIDRGFTMTVRVPGPPSVVTW